MVACNRRGGGHGARPARPADQPADARWLAEFEGARVSRHLKGAEWAIEGVAESNEVIASRVLAGDEEAIREALDTMVALANERVAQIRAQEEAARLLHEEELARAKQEAVDMTERFRALEPAAVGEEQDARRARERIPGSPSRHQQRPLATRAGTRAAPEAPARSGLYCGRRRM